MQHWAHTVLEDAFWLTELPPAHLREGLERLAKLAVERKHHVFRTAEIEELADEFSNTTSMLELSQLMWRVALSSGFENYAIFLLHQPPGAIFRNRICTSFKDTWISRYQEKSYQFIDPVVARASAGEGHFQFSDIKSTSTLVKNFWKDASTHGIGRNGFCCSLKYCCGMHIGISFCTTKSASQVRDIVSLNGYDLEAICKLAADRFAFMNSGLPLTDNILTEDELVFLRTLAISPNPEAALRVSPRFGSNENIQASIRLKLGVKSVFQAIAIAASKGWFNPLPYSPVEVGNPFPAMSGFSTLESTAAPTCLDSPLSETQEP